MRKNILLTLLVFPFLLAAEEITSPDGNMLLKFHVDNGVLKYELLYKNRQVVLPSSLGLELINWPSLMEGFQMERVQKSSFDETWQPVWGENKDIRNHYNEMAVTVSQPALKRQIIIRFRVYDEGIGFRYDFTPRWGIGTGIQYSNLSRSFMGDYFEVDGGVVLRRIQEAR